MAGSKRALALTLGISILAAAPLRPATGDAALAGQILGPSSPLPAATVYAYQLTDLTLRKVVADPDGRFLFESLPAGLYKIIAFKSGFVPTVVLLARATAEARQFLEVQLTEEGSGTEAGEDFWSIRAQIPPDVLRQLEVPAAPGTEARDLASATARFQAEMQAVTGVDHRADLGEAQLTGARLGLRGHLGETRVGLTGDFRELGPGPLAEPLLPASAGGQSQALALKVEGPSEALLRLTSLNNRLVTLQGETPSEVDFEHYRVSWSQNLGEGGRSDFAAQYTTENNYYRQGPIAPIGIPEGSRSFRLEGSYTTSLTQRSTLQAGFRYRDRENDFGSLDRAFLGTVTGPPEERIDVFGRGGLELRPAILMEYGLFSTMRDGRLSLTPQGGLMLQIGPRWQAATSLSQRVVEEEEEVRYDFLPTFYEELESCDQTEDYCYRVLLTRTWGDGEGLSIGAIHRRFAQTLRLYFSHDFFDHLESLFLVEGDRLPELQFALTRRLAPAVLARIESSLAAGGGGIFQGTGNQPFENEVRYLVTSVDTRFEHTSTGVYLAFHRLEQELNPLGRPAASAPGPESPALLEIERVQLMLTQDLDLFLDLASRWAVHLNMELSRGELPAGAVDGDEIRRRLVGGLAVRF